MNFTFSHKLFWSFLFLCYTSLSQAQSDNAFEVKTVELTSSKLYQGYPGKAILYLSNTGSSTIAPLLLQVFLSTDKNFDLSDVLLASSSGTGTKLTAPSYSLSMPVGSTIRTDVSFNFKDASLGKYHLIFKVGSGDALQQIVSEQIEIVKSEVDLVVEDLSISTDSVQAWGYFAFTLKVKNLKHGPVSNKTFLYNLKITDENNSGWPIVKVLSTNSGLDQRLSEEDQVLNDTLQCFFGYYNGTRNYLKIPPGNYKFEVSVTMRDSSDLDMSNNSIFQQLIVIPSQYKLEVLEQSATLAKVNADTVVMVKTIMQNTGTMPLERAYLQHELLTDDSTTVQTRPGRDFLNYPMAYMFNLKPGEKVYLYHTYKLNSVPEKFNVKSVIIEWRLDPDPSIPYLYSTKTPVYLKDIEVKSMKVLNKSAIPDTIYKGTQYYFNLTLEESFGKTVNNRGFILKAIPPTNPLNLLFNYKYVNTFSQDVLSTDSLLESFEIHDSIPDGLYNLNFFSSYFNLISDTTNKLINYNQIIYIKSDEKKTNHFGLFAKYASGERDTVVISHSSLLKAKVVSNVLMKYYYSADSIYTPDDLLIGNNKLEFLKSGNISTNILLPTVVPSYGKSLNKYQPMYIVLVNGQTKKQEAYKIIEDLILAVDDQEDFKEKRILFPNPAQEYFFYNSTSNERPDKIEIMDCKGRLVLSTNSTLEAIQIQNMEKGIYLVKIFLDQNVNVLKLIKN